MFDFVKITVISRLSILFHDLGLYRGQIHGVVCCKIVQVLTFVAVRISLWNASRGKERGVNRRDI